MKFVALLAAKTPDLASAIQIQVEHCFVGWFRYVLVHESF